MFFSHVDQQDVAEKQKPGSNPEKWTQVKTKNIQIYVFSILSLLQYMLAKYNTRIWCCWSHKTTNGWEKTESSMLLKHYSTKCLKWPNNYGDVLVLCVWYLPISGTVCRCKHVKFEHSLTGIGTNQINIWQTRKERRLCRHDKLFTLFPRHLWTSVFSQISLGYVFLVTLWGGSMLRHPLDLHYFSLG